MYVPNKFVPEKKNQVAMATKKLMIDNLLDSYYGYSRNQNFEAVMS